MAKFSAILDDRVLGSGIDQVFADIDEEISSEELTELINQYVEPNYSKGEVTSGMNKLRRSDYVDGFIEDGKYHWHPGPRLE